jgi:phospholipase/carboxylesterase
VLPQLEVRTWLARGSIRGHAGHMLPTIRKDIKVLKSALCSPKRERIVLQKKNGCIDGHKLAIAPRISDNLSFWSLLLQSIILPQQHSPQICIIWMHGLGASSSDMKSLAQELKVEPCVKHIFLDAPVRPVQVNNNFPMPAWYDIFSLQLTRQEDEKGIEQSAEIIAAVVREQISLGIPEAKIFLAGFSQGGAMALYTGLSKFSQLGGLIALSAYIPANAQLLAKADKQIPIFLAIGEQDGVVQPLWTELSISWLKSKGFKGLSVSRYRMEHSVCWDEIQDLSRWINENSSKIGGTSE